MEFLKDILGEDLYKQVATLINAHNGNEANKDKLVKIANLSTGEYVGKDKYANLETQFNSKIDELNNANSLIEELKKQGTTNESLQSKINEYEAKIQEIQKQQLSDKIDYALKLAAIDSKAIDNDYFVFKIKAALEKDGKNIEIDDKGTIKGIDEAVKAIKTSSPSMFEGQNNHIVPNPLPEPQGKPEPTISSLADALKEKYSQQQ